MRIVPVHAGAHRRASIAEIDRTALRIHVGVSVQLFAASAGLTVVWCRSMSDMGGMPMPGDWTLSMTWMRMPGQTWLHVAVLYIGMWMAMMMAMMLPSISPVLWRYRRTCERNAGRRRGWLLVVMGSAYFFVWALIGLAIFPVGAMLAELAMQWHALARATPFIDSLVVAVIGASQFSAWKVRRLDCCRRAPRSDDAPAMTVASAWKEGIRTGLDCGRCCGGLMAVMLFVGVMDLAAMALMTTAIAAERLAPSAAFARRAIGVLVMVAAALLFAHALPPGRVW